MTAANRPAIRILIIDDSTLVRGGIRVIMETHSRLSGIKVVGEAHSVASGITEAARLQPNVVLLDIRLPDGSGLAACREILRQNPKVCVLVLTSFVDDSIIYDSVTAGAQGYLMKEIEPLVLIEAVVAGAEGRAVFSSDATARMLRIVRGGPPSGDKPSLSILSRQEYRVLTLVAEGCTNKEVGARMGLSENTVKNYLANVFEKLMIKRRSQAVALYTQAVRRTK
jgi:DNA-binding NarL/FixJ family response regulator